METDDIVELFVAFGPVVVRRMFGGAGIFADGVTIAIISDGVIYLKVDDGNAATFERENCAPFTYMREGKPQALTSYRRMPDRLYDDPDELAVWARGSFNAALNQRARQKKPKASTPKTTKPKAARKRPSRRKSAPKSATKKATKRRSRAKLRG